MKSSSQKSTILKTSLAGFDLALGCWSEAPSNGGGGGSEKERKKERKTETERQAGREIVRHRQTDRQTTLYVQSIKACFLVFF